MNPGIGLPPVLLLQNAGIKARKAEKQHGISKRELKGRLSPRQKMMIVCGISKRELKVRIAYFRIIAPRDIMNLKKRIES